MSGSFDHTSIRGVDVTASGWTVWDGKTWVSYAFEPDDEAKAHEAWIKQVTEGEPLGVRHITAGSGRFHRVRLLMRSALRRVLGRVLATFGIGTALSDVRVPPAAQNCREGEDQ